MDPTVTMAPTIKLYSFSFLIVLKVRYTISLVNYTHINGVFECSYIDINTYMKLLVKEMMSIM